MTLLAPALMSSTSKSTTMTWSVGEEDFWVANNAGAFGGTVDRHGDHFYVRDCFGRYLGDYPTLSTAQQRLEKQQVVAA